MKTSDALIIGGLGLLGLNLLSQRQKDGGGDGGGINISLPDIISGGGDGGGLGGNLGLDLGGIGSIISEGIKAINGAAGAGVKSITDVTSEGTKAIKDLTESGVGAITDVTSKGVDAATGLGGMAGFYEDMVNSFKDIFGGLSKTESPTPKGQPGGDSEKDTAQNTAWNWFTARPEWFQTAAGTLGMAGAGYVGVKTLPTVVTRFVTPVVKTVAPRLVPLGVAATPLAGGFAAMGVGEIVKPEWNWNPLSKEFWGFGERGWWNQYFGKPEPGRPASEAPTIGGNRVSPEIPRTFTPSLTPSLGIPSVAPKATQHVIPFAEMIRQEQLQFGG